MAKTTKITVEVVKSTAKAHLVKASDGRQGWIQKRWLSDDSTVSEATFARAAETCASRNEVREADRAFRNSKHIVVVGRETEKAIGCEVMIEFAGSPRTVLAWFPKSACQQADGQWLVPGWMIRERNDRACEGVRPSGYYENHRFAKGERAFLVRGVQVLEATAV